MQLQKIEIENFKSYKGVHVLGPFDRFACIIGPNGSGKSNIMDAVVFVLGISGNELRLSQIKDIVHKESTYTKVSAYICNRKFTRLFTAKSAYYIDERQVSYANYVEALVALNLNIRMKNFLIFQNEITSLTLKSPLDLTKLFEELSDSVRYKEAYEEALKQQSKAISNCAAVYEERKELFNTMKEIKESKDQQTRFKDLLYKKQELHKQIIMHEIKDNVGKIRNLSLERCDLEVESYKLNSLIRSQEDSISKIKEEAAIVQRTYLESEQMLEEAKQNLKSTVYETECRSKEILVAKDEIKNLYKMKTEKEKELILLNKDIQDVQDAYSRFVEVQKQQSLDPEVEEQILCYERTYKDLMHRELSELNNLKVISYPKETIAKDLESRLTSLLTSIRKCEDRFVELHNSKKSLEDKIAMFNKSESDLRTKISSLLHKYELSVEEEKRNEEELNKVMNSIIRCKAAKRITANKSFIYTTVETLKSIFPGVCGRLIDLIKPTQQRYENALSLLIGSNDQSVVVDNERTAMLCINFIKDKRMCKLTFLPISRIKDKEIINPLFSKHKRKKEPLRNLKNHIDKDPAIERDPKVEMYSDAKMHDGPSVEVRESKEIHNNFELSNESEHRNSHGNLTSFNLSGVRLAVDCLIYSPEHKEIVNFIFRNSLIVDDSSLAAKVLYSEKLKVNVCTLDGITYFKSGLFITCGGNNQNKFSDGELDNLMKKRQEIVDSLQKVREYKSSLSTVEIAMERISIWRDARNKEQEKLDCLQEELVDLEKSRINIDKELNNLEQQIDEIRLELETISKQKKGLLQKLKASEQQIFGDVFCKTRFVDLDDYRKSKEKNILMQKSSEYENLKNQLLCKKRILLETISELCNKINHLYYDTLGMNKEKNSTVNCHQITNSDNACNINRLKTTDRVINEDKTNIEYSTNQNLSSSFVDQIDNLNIEENIEFSTLLNKSIIDEVNENAIDDGTIQSFLLNDDVVQPNCNVDLLRQNVCTLEQELKDRSLAYNEYKNKLRGMNDELNRLVAEWKIIEERIVQAEVMENKLEEDIACKLKFAMLEEIELPRKKEVDFVPNKDSLGAENSGMHCFKPGNRGSTSNSHELNDINGQDSLYSLLSYKTIDFSDLKGSLHGLRKELDDTIAQLNQCVPLILDQKTNPQAKYMKINSTYDRLKEVAIAAKEEFNKIRKQRNDVFMDCFTKVNEELDKIYKFLTRRNLAEGSAYLSLENNVDAFKEGIRYYVMPPTKRFRDITQLSGGEKTMAIIALTFAMHFYAPAPFYVFDEIDSALDKHNVRRLGEFIENSQAQFLVISLRPGLFTYSECLFGVYKDPNRNTSQVLSYRIEDSD